MWIRIGYCRKLGQLLIAFYDSGTLKNKTMIAHPRPNMLAVKGIYKINSAMWPSFQLVKYFIPVLFICKFHKDWIKITQAVLRTKSNMGFFDAQEQMTPKWIVRSCWNSNLSKMLCLSRLSAVFLKIQWKLNMLCSGQGQMWGFFGTKRQVTPKSVVQYVQNSNSFEILCLFRLTACWIKLQLKLSRLCSGQGQIWEFSALKGK